jgi:hypothetical protein
MRTTRFDDALRSLTRDYSRRAFGAALSSLVLAATPGPLSLVETEAKKKKRKKRGNRVSPTCADGIKNGSESDVDCGGSCPRCAKGKTCATRSDCAGGLCAFERCQACAVDRDCGEDADSQCYCADPATGGPNVCTKANATGGAVASCASCPPDTICFTNLASGMFLCFKPCGASS